MHDVSRRWPRQMSSSFCAGALFLDCVLTVWLRVDLCLVIPTMLRGQFGVVTLSSRVGHLVVQTGVVSPLGECSLVRPWGRRLARPCGPFWPACARWVSCARCVAAMAAADVVVVGAGALITASSSRFDSVTACSSLVHGLWRARLCLMGAPPCGRVPCCCAAAGHCPGRLCSLRGAA